MYIVVSPTQIVTYLFIEKHHLELAGLALEAPSIERLEAWLRPIGVDEDELTG